MVLKDSAVMDGDAELRPVDGPDPPPEPGRGRRRAAWRYIVISVIILSAAGVGYVWLTSARALQGYGDEWGSPVQPGHTLYTDTGIYPAASATATIDFRDIRPRVTLNTADAIIELLTCTTPSGSMRIGTVLDADIEHYCAPMTPWRSGTLTTGSDADTYLIFAITPHREGRVEIDGEDVHYRDGIRFGTQHVGATIVATTQ